MQIRDHFRQAVSYTSGKLELAHARFLPPDTVKAVIIRRRAAEQQMSEKLSIILNLLCIPDGGIKSHGGFGGSGPFTSLWNS